MSDSADDAAGPTRLLQALVASAPEPLYVVGADFRILFVNPAGLRLLGYPDPQELLGEASHSTIHYKRPDGSICPEESCPLLRPIRTGELVRVDRDWFVRRDGSMVPVAYSSAPLQMDQGRGAVVTFRDIVEQLRDEEAFQAQAVHDARVGELRASRARLVEAAAHERERLARDLHDGVQQRLVEAVVALQLAQRAMERDPDLLRGHLDAALAATRAAIGDLRELSQGIYPRILVERGLAAAAASLADRTPLPVEVDVPADRFSEAIEAAAYFVIAEGLTNVAKHAHAQAARVSVRIHDGELLVEVTDDGAGGAAEGAGSGLRGMADRVAAAGGSVQIDSVPGRGTTVRAGLPLNVAES